MSRKSAQTRCCACLGTNSKLNGLTLQDENKIPLHTKLKTCLSEIEWLTSYLICEQCTELLDISYTFRETCLKSERARHLQEEQIANEECDKIGNAVESQILNDTPYKLDLLKEEKVEMEEIVIKDETIIEDKCESSSENVSYCDSPEFEFENEKYDKIKDVEDSPEDIKVKNKNIIVNIYKPNPKNNQNNVSSHDICELTHSADTEDKPETRKKFDFPCEKCDKTYKMITTLVEHCVKEHGMNKLNVRPFICHRCPYRFHSPSDLTQHIKCHEIMLSNICTHCGKCFATKSNLITHEKVHLNKCEYKCEECGKVFNTIRDKRLHQVKVHTNPKCWEFYCEICNKSFPFKLNYERHMKRHIGDKKFECHVCLKKFVDKWDLQRHIKIHSDVKEHKCTHCDREYKDPQYIKIHMAKIHGINVDQVKIPSKERKYACHICSKSYCNNYKLTKHLLTHSGEKPFDCPICGNKFKDKYYIKKHLRVTHKIEKLL